MTISNVANGLRSGVCTSTTRPTAPYEGQMIYETDTDMLAIWNGSAWRYFASAVPTVDSTKGGGILQVVSANYSTAQENATSTYADTGLTATITPKSTSSKILVMVAQNGIAKVDSNTYMGTRLLRGTTEIAVTSVYTANSQSTANIGASTIAINYLDSPSTTSAVSYKTQFRSGANLSKVIVQDGSSVSTMTLMEIAA